MLIIIGSNLSAYAGPSDVAGGWWRESCAYTGDLLQLSRKTRTDLPPLPNQFRVIAIPLRMKAWAEALSNHPNLDGSWAGRGGSSVAYYFAKQPVAKITTKITLP